jgi:transposase-like protein
MKRLSPDGKTAIIMQAINRGSRAIAEIAALNNIGKSTLTRWVRQYKLGILPESKPSESNVVKDNKPLHSEQKFKHILASNGLDDVSLGKYCRQNGLYAHELKTWKNDFMNNKDTGDSSAAIKAELSEMKAKNKKLESELRRKDKALSEASALLILKKKANLIWGESEDD